MEKFTWANSADRVLELLGPELLTRPRLSRIYYDGQFFAYPLVAKDVVRRLAHAQDLAGCNINIGRLAS
jgi:hypothetical protein